MSSSYCWKLMNLQWIPALVRKNHSTLPKTKLSAGSSAAKLRILLGTGISKAFLKQLIDHLHNCDKLYKYQNALPILFCQITSGSSEGIKFEYERKFVKHSGSCRKTKVIMQMAIVNLVTRLVSLTSSLRQ